VHPFVVASFGIRNILINIKLRCELATVVMRCLFCLLLTMLALIAEALLATILMRIEKILALTFQATMP